VSCPTVVVNFKATAKLWPIAHENGHKTRKVQFLVVSLKHAIVITRHPNPLEPQNYGQYLMKMAIKHEYDEFLVISIKHVRVLNRHANPPRTKKLWAITPENDHKTRK